MYCTVKTGGLRGLESYIASVEVDVSRGLPAFDMVGLLGSEIKEARERICVALKNSQVELPAVKITVNISPAGIHKVGTAFDLPVALGIMAAQGQILQERLSTVWVAGELGLNGEVKSVRGILPMLLEAAKSGMRECILPLENLKEGSLLQELSLMGVHSLHEAAQYLNCPEKERERLRHRAGEEAARQCPCEESGRGEENWDFSMVREMYEAKRAAMVAAAGFHNLLFIGPPGAGKTMLAKCIPSILPPLTREEQRQVSAIYSVAGKLPQGQLLQKRPFVSPHHTVTAQALAGGGNVPRPGMVSLAHKGILFLDEMAEFRRSTLDVLRQPLEEGRIFLAKSGGSFLYPADFMLVAATNPCPCGYYPDREKCRCTAHEVHRYMSRISGPLLDRIDICAGVESVSVGALWKETASAEPETDSAALQEKVQLARQLQARRYAETAIGVNSRLGAGQIRRYCSLGLSEQQYLEQAASSMQLSARACHRILRVARTLADLEGSERISCLHVSEAICYRRRGNGLWKE